MSHNLRVCDRCIVKRLKCDRQRPTCSRCRESSSDCAYTQERQVPGPAKGSRYKVRAKRARSTSTSNRTGLSEHLAISKDQYRHVFQVFFEKIHPSIPLFEQEPFLAAFESDCSTRLHHLVAILCIAIARLEEYSAEDAERRLIQKLSPFRDGPVSLATSSSSLEEVQEACLLVYFAFLHFPDRQSWMMTGYLIRHTYALGLHQLDNPTPGLMFEKKPGDLESWRRIWWVVYLYDSYTNISAGTPNIVELASISTAISAGVYLSASITDMWETIQSLAEQSPVNHFLLVLPITALVNEGATIHRLAIQRPTARLSARKQALDDALSATWLALPSGYFIASSSGADHSVVGYHRRIRNSMLLELARLFLRAATLHQPCDTHSVIHNWTQVMKSCTVIVGLVKAWDSDFLTSVDSALGFVVATVLNFQEVYIRCIDLEISAEIKESVSTQTRILQLFLEQLARHWFLSQYMLASQEHLVRCLPERMTQANGAYLLRAYNGLLHQRWLQQPLIFEEEEDDSLPQEEVPSNVPWMGLTDVPDWPEITDFFADFYAQTGAL